MTSTPVGPGVPYSLLFDDDDRPGISLPPALQAIYGGDWRIHAPPEQRPLVITNFVASHDGRISFNIPGRSGGNPVSRNSAHDHWLMGLIRARADAILTGGGTLRTALQHTWLPETVFPADAESFAELRRSEGRTVAPLLVVVSATGDLPPNIKVLQQAHQPVLLATTVQGVVRLRAELGPRPHISYWIAEGEQVDFAALLADLRRDFGVQVLLSEGGANVYARLIAARVIDETFLTTSPIVIGNPATPNPPRPGLVEGVAFSPDDPPRLRLLSLRRHDDYLFQHSRFH